MKASRPQDGAAHRAATRLPAGSVFASHFAMTAALSLLFFSIIIT